MFEFIVLYKQDGGHYFSWMTYDLKRISIKGVDIVLTTIIIIITSKLNDCALIYMLDLFTEC